MLRGCRCQRARLRASLASGLLGQGWSCEPGFLEPPSFRVTWLGHQLSAEGTADGGFRGSDGRFELGVTEKRTQWAIRWVREGLGCLQFEAGPLDHLRPSLGPLYAWASAGPRAEKLKVAQKVHFFALFL